MCSVWSVTTCRHSLGVVPGGVWGACGCSVVFVGGFSGGVTPGPFPNPEAKPACADGTAPGRVWESRSPPAFFFVCGGVVSPLHGLCGHRPCQGLGGHRVVGVWHHPTFFVPFSAPWPVRRSAPTPRAERARVSGSRASARRGRVEKRPGAGGPVARPEKASRKTLGCGGPCVRPEGTSQKGGWGRSWTTVTGPRARKPPPGRQCGISVSTASRFAGPHRSADP